MERSNRSTGITLTLLGTGTPIPDRDRHGPSQAIEISGEVILVDCGAGVMHRVLEAGLNVNAISHVLLTHLHSDHVSGLVDLLWAGWVGRWWTVPPVLVGPQGTREFVDRLLYAFDEDIRLRTDEGALTKEGLRPRIVEIEDGWIQSVDGWKVTGFRVDHFPVQNAFGFRFESDGRVVVISGDTRMCENLAKYSVGADILVSEVAWEEGMSNAIEMSDGPQRARWERILKYHMSSIEIGKLAQHAMVNHLVLTHLMLVGGEPENLISDVRGSFSGKVSVGTDLCKFSTANRDYARDIGGSVR